VAGAGRVYYKEDANGLIGKDGNNYARRDFNQFASFLCVAAAMTFIISFILLIAFCSDRLTLRARHVLATFNLILEFAIAVTVSIEASQTSNRRAYLNSNGVP
jgi:hypothetical protein